MININDILDYNKKGECFAITSYCNTKEKVQVLSRTIDNISQYKLPIFVHAHYPLSDEIQKKIHSYFYSSDNPIIDRWNEFWYFTGIYKLAIRVYDYYFTTLKGWDESIKMLCDYDRIHIINYDTNLVPELFNISKKINQSLFLQNKDTSKNYIIPTYFCLNKKSYDFFRENITIEKYLNFTSLNQGKFIPLVEEFIPSFTTGDDFYQIPYTDYDEAKLLEYDVASDTRFNWDKTLNIIDAKIFIGDLNGIANLLFFDVKKNLKIGVEIFRKGSGTMASSIGGTISSDSIFSLSLPLEQIENIFISVDNNPINNKLIHKFFQLKCKIFIE